MRVRREERGERGEGDRDLMSIRFCPVRVIAVGDAISASDGVIALTIG